MPKRIRNVLSILSFVYVACLVLAVNFKTPLVGEDFALTAPYERRADDFAERAHFVALRIREQATLWNVRLGELLAIIFLGPDKAVFNFLNSAMFLLFCWLVLVYAIGRLPELNSASTYGLVAMIAMLIMTLLPGLGVVVFWLDGASNYLWGLSILLFLALPYRLLLSGQDIMHRWGASRLGGFVLLGFMAGLTNENTVPALLLAILVPLGVRLLGRRPQHLPRWYMRGAIALAAGFTLLVLAPSTARRRAYYESVYGPPQLDPVSLLDAMGGIAVRFLDASRWLLIVSLAAVILFLLARRLALVRAPHVSFAKVAYLLATGVVSLLLLAAAPYYDDRASLLACFSLFCVIAYSLNQVLDSRLQVPMGLVILLLGIWQGAVLFRAYALFYDEAMSRHYALVQARSSGARTAEVLQFASPTSRLLNTGEAYDRFASKTHYANYYGLDEIIILPLEP